MKTVIDAVNELKAEWPTGYIMSIELANGELNYGEFIRCVADMTNNKGWKNTMNYIIDKEYEFSDSGKTWELGILIRQDAIHNDDYHFQSKIGNKTEWFKLIREVKPVTLSPIYTEAMSEDKKLPPIGSEYLDEDNQLCKALFHYSCFVIGEMLEHSPISQYPVFSTSRNDRIKPITPPIELDDGKAYSFTYKVSEATSLHDCIGIYDSSKSTCMWVKGNAYTLTRCTDIQPLTIK